MKIESKKLWMKKATALQQRLHEMWKDAMQDMHDEMQMAGVKPFRFATCGGEKQMLRESIQEKHRSRIVHRLVRRQRQVTSAIEEVEAGSRRPMVAAPAVKLEKAPQTEMQRVALKIARMEDVNALMDVYSARYSSAEAERMQAEMEFEKRFGKTVLEIYNAIPLVPAQSVFAGN